jgi:3-phenylpropionate/trans-cinnamate dioxygenase ferredoxin reductase component
MTDRDPFLIVGAGLAGAKAAETLRAEGYDGPLVLLGAEAERPYDRPPLSKGYLTGAVDADGVHLHPPGWYHAQGIELRVGVRVVHLDPVAHRVRLDTGEHLPYRRLLLATGSEARPLSVPGADHDDVQHLRTAADAYRLRAALTGPTSSVVVVGAGWIGLEVAAAARGLGHAVTVVDPAPTPLHHALGPQMGELFARLHRDHGVDLRMRTGVTRIRRGASGAAVVTGSGAELPADLVVVGIGARPNTELAAAAGLHVDDGVVVDAAMRTSAPDVHAAGDIAAVPHPHHGRRLRVEHWANALHTGPAAARAMLGRAVVHDRLPYFFTDQYDLGMEYTGLGSPEATVVCRGEPEDGAFIAFWMRDGRVEAGMNVNTWDVADAIEALIRSGEAIDSALLRDPSVPLSELAARATRPAARS